MGANTAIEWATHTFNPWLGCQKVSEACTNCYAEAWAKRTGRPELWRYTRKHTSENYWRQPYRWNREARAAGVRARVFCASLADVFEDGPVLGAWRADLFALIRETPALDWLLLTKRPENIARMLPAEWGDGYANVWLGTTVENQARAEERIPHLLAVPAAVRFLSCEPLLGALDLNREWLEPFHEYTPSLRRTPRIGWVIVGGESGPGARPMRPEWAQDLRNECKRAGVCFFFKQWGEHDTDLVRVGKKSAGRYLGGRTWDEVPR